jgi:hypothetical protein
VLTPYLSEEIIFDPTQTNGVKTVFDLTNLVQQQLQSISVVQAKTTPQLKPYQQTYNPLTYSLVIKNKSALINFPFIIASDEEKIKLADKATTNLNGEIQVNINYVEPLNQLVAFSLNPDISTLMGSDSVGKAGVIILKQFINTSLLKVYANVSPINIFISATEANLTKPTGAHILHSFIEQKFTGAETKIVNTAEQADFIIEAQADTKEDISSDVLTTNYNIKLAALLINLQLKNKLTNEVIYKSQVTDLYGYANTLEKAGLNAYQSQKLTAKFGEAIFFLKRKVLVY